MTSGMRSNVSISLEEGWRTIEEQGINVLQEYLLEGKVRYEPITMPDGTQRVQLFTNKELSTLYTTVYTMATQKDNLAAPLYTKYSEVVQDYLETKVKTYVTAPENYEDDEALLRAVVKKWEDHKTFIQWLGVIFQYLDRYHVQLNGFDRLERMGIKKWMKHIYVPLSDRIIMAYLNLLELDRHAACAVPTEKTDYVYTPAIDEKLAREITLMVTALQDYCTVYPEKIIPHALQTTAAFYTSIASVWLGAVSFADYMKKAERALKDEETRCRTYFFKDLMLKLQKTVQDCLLVKPQEKLLALPTAVEFLLQNNQREDLQRAFSLFSRCDGCLPPLAAAFRKFILSEGCRIIQAKVAAIEAKKQKSVAFASLTSNPDVADLEFVYSLILLHTKYQEYVDLLFMKEFNFTKALKDAFENFMNRDVGPFPMAAFLCTFADKLIRRPPNASIPLPMTTEAMEVMVHQLVTLFSFLSDKDLFAEGYRQQLARRLIGSQGLPDDTEKYLVASLKHECGGSFSSKLEGMLNDITEASEPREKFAQFLRDHPLSENLDFTVQVLTTGHWPSYPPTEMKLPPVVEEGMSRFQQFYDTLTTHRKLMWIHSLAQAIVNAKLKREHQLVCTAFQAQLLLAFNTAPELSLEDLQQYSGIELSDLKKHVKCLHAKYAIIIKIDNAEDAQNPRYKANLSFTCNAKRFKLPVPVQEEAQQKDNLQEDRTIAIQAAIVRVMKARKELGHSQLVAEVTNHLSLFKPQPKDIKQCIEQLIQREYLERGEEESNVYTYVA
eukprot:Blabericola_migrator_1__5508@NODE_280_length_10436_cov_136_209085_g230_i0_p3_GENE_NODE_280_length_10436_cov_136_209085_g230_i0NODE_280_length_10436_cov_136_209085_g230_i0_p3_ORF_typecomplete_len780_score202_10Cullin/PF00888_22/3_5e123Cullin_Nedd8/PF10557_9/2_5e26DUF501/PF04417_12/0_11Cyclin_C/PF02984_19/6_2e02Cyclin_C/PF02984_19/4_1Cyclin_C/PF02984_19/1_1e03HEPN_DZIP3/PF18738_1/0_33RGS/PF00615_19/3_5e03RGS/PF00615_19/1_3e03RGS/PF00615_19/1_1RGS/PF00615_19/2_6e03_NODE_280_length_10436_cov_136_209